MDLPSGTNIVGTIKEPNAEEIIALSPLVIAAELVKAAKAGDTRAAADAEKRWYANADEIEKQALEMADEMTYGIIQQFLNNFF